MDCVAPLRRKGGDVIHQCPLDAVALCFLGETRSVRQNIHSLTTGVRAHQCGATEHPVISALQHVQQRMCVRGVFLPACTTRLFEAH